MPHHFSFFPGDHQLGKLGGGNWEPGAEMGKDGGMMQGVEWSGKRREERKKAKRCNQPGSGQPRICVSTLWSLSLRIQLARG